MKPSNGRGSIRPLDEALGEVRGAVDSIWGTLAQLRRERARSRILFVGMEPDAGTTVVAAAAAMGLALNLRIGVTLVEADVARSSLAGYLGLPARPGMSDLLDGKAELAACRRSINDCPDLHVFTGGTRRRPVPGELASERGRKVLDEITRDDPFVLFDAPPILDHAETRVLLERSDGVVLVLRARSTETADVRKALVVFEEAQVPVIGSVMNRYKSDMPFGLD